MALTVEDQTLFSFLNRFRRVPATQKQSEFERHVESRQLINVVWLSARNVVNAQSATAYEPDNLEQSDVSTVSLFKCGTRQKPAVKDAKDNGLKERFIW
jgi:hypothetical protein